MTHQNLVLTEKAIKNHSKRLQKELKNYSKDISLGEAQNLFSKSLGFSSFHELKTILFEKKLNKINDTNDFISFIENIEHKSNFIWILSNGDVRYNPLEQKRTAKEDAFFVDTKEYGLNKYDFENIQNIFLSEVDKFNLSVLDEKIVTHLRVPLNELVVKEKSLYRSFDSQIYKKNNIVYAVKLLISYRIHGNDFARRYEDVKHLF